MILMDFQQVIKDRFSVRQFRDKAVEQEKIDAILEAGRLAPTAKNLQPIKIYVVKSEEWLAKIDNASPCRYGAPLVLIVCWDQQLAYVNNRWWHSTYEMDSCIVATHMLLESTNQWLGSVRIELFDRWILRSEFNIPENLFPVCVLPMGYNTDDCPVSPMHSTRKSIEELVEYK